MIVSAMRTGILQIYCKLDMHFAELIQPWQSIGTAHVFLLSLRLLLQLPCVVAGSWVVAIVDHLRQLLVFQAEHRWPADQFAHITDAAFGFLSVIFSKELIAADDTLFPVSFPNACMK